jgi:hypothetical protein
MMSRWSGNNPEFFIVLDGPHNRHDADAGELDFREQNQFVEAVRKIVVQSLSDDGFYQAENIDAEGYTIPPAAEGFAHLFDLTQAVRSITDDAMRAAFLGGSLYKAVSIYKRWKKNRPIRNVSDYSALLLSESAIKAICEYHVRTAYGVTGDLNIRSVVMQPWQSELGTAGINPYEKHLVTLASDNGKAYQFLTDSSGDILKHYVFDAEASGFIETSLPSEYLASQEESIQYWSPYDANADFANIIRECITIADELGLNIESQWLQTELSGYDPPIGDGIIYQRFEKATLL